jgi:membrane-associated protease RseP (regulator of RpoE activity)
LEPLQNFEPLQADWQRPAVKFRDRVWLHLLLFALTVVTTTTMGAFHYASFVDDFRGSAELPMPFASLLVRGLWYSATVLGILGCHELGHYFACRYYDVDASLPFFLPLPPPFLTGTLGAVIRIREPFPSKRALFDIGIAGPIAGFAVTVPTLFLGIAMSHLVRLPEAFVGYELGEPPLLKLASWLVWGTAPQGYTLNLHPMAFAAWFGMLATALNLFPIGQLDGGHISYAVLGHRSVYVTFVAITIVATMGIFTSSWVVFALLTIVMLVMFGPRHPKVVDEHVRLSGTRLLLALFAVVMFVLCFTPSPIREAMDLIRR